MHATSHVDGLSPEERFGGVQFVNWRTQTRQRPKNKRREGVVRRNPAPVCRLRCSEPLQLCSFAFRKMEQKRYPG